MSDQDNIAIIAQHAGQLTVDNVPMPVPRPDEAVIAVKYGGICGSDLHYWQEGRAGASVLREPMVLGHELSGVIAEPAADGTSPPPGTAITVHPGSVDGTAGKDYPVGRPHLSPHGTYLGSAARLPHTQGIFMRYVALPSRMLRPLPSGVSLRTGALAEPAAVAWHAVARVGTVLRRRAAVVGIGPIGALAVATLRAHGCADITALDIHQHPLDVARSLGARHALRADKLPASPEIRADIVIEASGTTAGLRTALAIAAPGARVVMVGLITEHDVPPSLSSVVTREVDLLGSFRFANEIDDVLVAMSTSALAPQNVISHEFPAEEALTAFETAADAAISSKVLLRF